MIGDWSNEVRRECAGSNARFEFPVRPLGWGKLLGAFLVGFAVLFCWGPAQMVWEFIQDWIEHGPDVGNLLFGVFLVLFVVAGCLPAMIGLLILFGRCRVEWKDGRLRSTEILGPLRWTHRMPAKPIRKLEVSAVTSRSGGAPRQRLDRLGALTAEFEDGSKRLVVLGYPKDWLLGLAEELKLYVGGAAFSAGPAQVAVVERLSPEEVDDDGLEQPPDSLVVLEQNISGVRLTVPPAGLWRGSVGFFAFALMWCAFMVVLTVMMVSSGLRKHDGIWIPILFIVVFWAVGLGMLASAINMGRRTATLDVQGGRLCVETKGLFGAKRLEWSQAEIAAIRADSSGMEVNERPVIELQIYPIAGKKVGLLAGRDEDELRWMAARLRGALQVPAHKRESSTLSI